MALRHFFVVNPRSFAYSGNFEQVLSSMEMFFRKTLTDDYRVYVSTRPRDASTAVRRYILAAPAGTAVRIYAIGGDGILFDCLQGVIGMPNAELAHLPYGSINDFVLSFGREDLSAFRDLALQISAPTVRADALRCGTSHAINCCIVGYEAFTFYKGGRTGNVIRSNAFTRRFISPYYKLYNLYALSKHDLRRQEYTVVIDGEEFSGEFAAICIQNGTYHSKGLSPIPAARPDDGYLDVLLWRGASLPRALSLLGAYHGGRYDKHEKNFVYRRARSVKISSGNAMHICADGEGLVGDKLDVQLLPGAVKFVAPDGLNFLPPNERAAAREATRVANMVGWGI